MHISLKSEAQYKAPGLCVTLGERYAVWPAVGILYVFTYLLIFIFSMWMFDIYYLGDQIYYREFWARVKEATLYEIPHLQFTTTGSIEPGFGLLVWAFSSFFEKEYFISSLNGIFACQVVYLLRRYKAPFLIILSFLTNYYFIFLIIPTERLKIAFLILLFALLIENRSRYLFFILAPLFHLQMLLIYAFYYVKKVTRILNATLYRNSINLYDVSWMVLIFVLGLLVVTAFSTQFLHKLSAHRSFEVKDLLDTFIFGATVFTFCRERVFSAMLYIGLLITAFIVGEERITMMSFVVFCYFFISQRKFYHPAFVSVLCYFNIKAVFFVLRIMEFNTGFGK